MGNANATAGGGGAASALASEKRDRAYSMDSSIHPKHSVALRGLSVDSNAANSVLPSRAAAIAAGRASLGVRNLPFVPTAAAASQQQRPVISHQHLEIPRSRLQSGSAKASPDSEGHQQRSAADYNNDADEDQHRDQENNANSTTTTSSKSSTKKFTAQFRARFGRKTSSSTSSSTSPLPPNSGQYPPGAEPGGGGNDGGGGDGSSAEDPLESMIRPRTSTVSGPTRLDESALPAVFKWDGGGKEVYIKGTFSDWKPIKMSHSHGDFVAIVDVPEGNHQYKYIVDGIETVDKTALTDEGKSKNVINVRKSDFEVFEALAMDLASNCKTSSAAGADGLAGSPPGKYSQEIPNFTSASDPFPNGPQSSATSGGGGGGQGAGPPILPPHLLQVILNMPSSQFGEPTLLPQPNHVMLNHLYALSIKDGVMVLSATNRFRKKYVTTVLYKPI